MTRDTYIRLTKPLRENEKKARLLAYINKGLTAFLSFCYIRFFCSLTCREASAAVARHPDPGYLLCRCQHIPPHRECAAPL